MNRYHITLHTEEHGKVECKFEADDVNDLEKSIEQFLEDEDLTSEIYTLHKYERDI